MSLYLLCFLFLPRTSFAEETKHSMADLQALQREKAWTELFDHLDDIPPAKRDASWKELAEAASLGRLATVDKKGDPEATLTLLESIGDRFPFLLQSDSFLEPRREIGMKAFSECFDRQRVHHRRDEDRRDEDRDCRRSLLAFVRSAPDREFAREAAKLASQHLKAAFATEFFEELVIDNGDESACSNPALGRSVVAALVYPMDDPNSDAASALAFGPCWKELRSALVEEVGGRGPGSKYYDRTCKELLARKALTGLRAKRCEKN
jgi:hypothetical protein